MESERIDLAVVQAWHEAVNRGELDRLAELLDDDVEFGGPRGTGRGATMVLEWARHSGIQLQPVRGFQRGDHVVVEEIATWQAPDAAEPSPPSDVAIHFTVRGDQVRRVVRYDSLADALAAAGLDAARDLQPAPGPALDVAPPGGADGDRGP